jgi:hypothetical protein
MRKAATLLSIALLASMMIGANVGAEGGECIGGLPGNQTVTLSVGVCAEDTREGDPGNETSTCEDYKAFTGVTADASEDASGEASEDSSGTDASALAGGEENCDTGFSGERSDEGLVFDAEAENDAVGFARADGGWTQSESRFGTFNAIGGDFFVVTDAADAGGEVYWDDGYRGSSVDYNVFVNSEFTDQFIVGDVNTGDVGPPAPPNPGWGDVVQDDLFEESLPTDE